jgi:hypothetical protein
LNAMQSQPGFGDRFGEFLACRMCCDTCQKCDLSTSWLPIPHDPARSPCTRQSSTLPDCGELIGGPFLSVLIRIPEKPREELMSSWNGVPALHITRRLPPKCVLDEDFPIGVTPQRDRIIFEEGLVLSAPICDRRLPSYDLSNIESAIATYFAMEMFARGPMWPLAFNSKLIADRVKSWHYRPFNPALLTNTGIA